MRFREPLCPDRYGAIRVCVRRRRVVWAAAAVAVTLWGPSAARGADVLTYHNDNARTGVNTGEMLLTPATVAPATFGKVFSHAVDGAVYAQPLVMTNVMVPGSGFHNVVFVATEHDSVYAFDASDASGANAAPLWKTSFLDGAPPGVVVSPVPDTDISSSDLGPEVGITATPVIDPSTGTIYVVAKTKEVSGTKASYVQRLHAMDVGSGTEKLGGPVVITATIATRGLGDGADIAGFLSFDSQWQLNRPALLLSRGAVFVAFGSHSDQTESITPGCRCSSHGWLLAYEALTLQPVAAFNVTPDQALGSIWMSGDGPAADSQGNVFFVTGNGLFDLDAGGLNAGNSVVKLALTPRGLNLVDFFAPYDQEALSFQDLDLGSGGISLLPDQPTARVHLAVACGKAGKVYLLDRDNLGGFHADGDRVVQSFGGLHGCYSTPVFFNGRLYYGSSDRLDAFDFNAGTVNPQPSSEAAPFFPFPGVTPSLSANGSSDAVLWVIENGQPAVLRAYLAGDLTRELYNSNQADGNADVPGDGVKFSVPTVCNGKVYVGTQSGLAVYGLLGPRQRAVRRSIRTGR